MAEPLKNMYDPEFFEYLCKVLRATVPKFNDTKFIHSIFDTEWPDLELKQRTRKVTLALHRVLPDDFEDAVKYITKISDIYLKADYTKSNYPLIFLPDYIEVYGLDHIEISMKALVQITPLVSAEFAIRPFIIRYPSRVMKTMRQWSKHENHHVRRLASEGCRPRLPWAMGLPDFKKDPSPILPILENLKKDKSEYVRRSVANNLNDIAKDHPEIVLNIAERWKGKSPETNWILKHGSRTLLKRGLNQALVFHGYDPGLKTGVEKLSLEKGKIKIGDSATFEFCAVNKEKKGAEIRLEYAITFLTSTGKNSRKVFKIAEGKFKPGEKKYFTRKQRFTDFTTRKHYPGKHKLEIVVNGTPKSSIDF
ncbi:MAG: DNA alkylation repair protein, partial [Cyclobacteriaceae bacterium]